MELKMYDRYGLAMGTPPMRFTDDHTYRQYPAMNWSRLKLLRDKSARALQYELLNGPTFTGNAATRFGNLCHTVALEPEELTNRYRVAVETNKRTKAYKTEVADAATAGLELVTTDDMRKAHSMAAGWHLSIDNLSQRYPSWDLLGTELGMATQLTDPDVAMKGKLDAIFHGGSCLVIVDYKTTSSPLDTRSLRSIIGGRGYHIQQALYRRLYRAVNVDMVEVPIEMAWVFASTEAPHETRVILASQAMSDAADHELDQLIQEYHEAISYDQWPGVEPLDVADLLPWHLPSTMNVPEGAPNPLPF